MKNKVITKQIVGIDIGKDSFYACYKILHQDGSIIIKGTRSFTNKVKGIIDFYAWSQKRNITKDIKPVYVMEATGVYYEDLAYFLNDKKEKVSVQLAQKIKYFAKSCNIKTKTDKVDAKMIAEFGIEKNLKGLDIWTPPSKNFKSIRDLSREHTSIIDARTSTKCQLHAFKHSHRTNSAVMKVKYEQIDFYNEQLDYLEEIMRSLVKEDKELAIKIKNIETIKGVSFITIIKVVTELNGFKLFKNIRQLVSYVGLDIVEDSSGNRKGKTKISKKGNKRVRVALYMPTLSAIRYNNTLKVFYERIMEKRTIKKQGMVAVMRKLLIYIYTLWNNETVFVENYQK